MQIPTNLLNTQSTKVSPGPSQSPPAPEPQSAYSNELLAAIRSDDAIECFGGRLFRRTDRYGHPLISFAVENMNELEIERANGSYAAFSSMDASMFLFSYGEPEIVVTNSQKKYTVFSFRIGKTEFSLRERYDAGQNYKVPAEYTMAKLVSLLSQYSGKLSKSHDNYRPLNCLSLETVFVDEENRLRILPLQAFQNQYPIEIPREIDGTDIKSDLYSAAFVAVQAESGGVYGKVPMIEPNATVIRNCMKVAREWRPALQVVINELKCNGKVQAPGRDPYGNSTNSTQAPKRWSFHCSNILSKVKGAEERETQEQIEGTWDKNALTGPQDANNSMFTGKV